MADDQTIAAHLQAALRHDPRFGDQACVYNFGRAYLFSTPERQLFERLLLEGHAPDVAVFIDGLNDFYFAGGEPEKDDVFKAGLVPPRRLGANELVLEWFARTPLGRLARGLGARSGNPAKTAPVAAAADTVPARERIAGVIRRYRGNQRLIAATAAASGVRPLFVWQPVPTYRYDLRRHAFQGAGFERHQLSGAGYAWLDSALAAGAITMEPRFLWCGALAEGDTLQCYVDRVHYSGRMNRRVAERVVVELHAMGLSARK